MQDPFYDFRQTRPKTLIIGISLRKAYCTVWTLLAITWAVTSNIQAQELFIHNKTQRGSIIQSASVSEKFSTKFQMRSAISFAIDHSSNAVHWLDIDGVLGSSDMTSLASQIASTSLRFKDAQWDLEDEICVLLDLNKAYISNIRFDNFVEIDKRIFAIALDKKNNFIWTFGYHEGMQQRISKYDYNGLKLEEFIYNEILFTSQTVVVNDFIYSKIAPSSILLRCNVNDLSVRDTIDSDVYDVYSTPQGEVVYSIIAPNGLFIRRVNPSFGIESLGSIGFKAEIDVDVVKRNRIYLYTIGQLDQLIYEYDAGVQEVSTLINNPLAEIVAMHHHVLDNSIWMIEAANHTGSLKFNLNKLFISDGAIEAYPLDIPQDSRILDSWLNEKDNILVLRLEGEKNLVLFNEKGQSLRQPIILSNSMFPVDLNFSLGTMVGYNLSYRTLEKRSLDGDFILEYPNSTTAPNFVEIATNGDVVLVMKRAVAVINEMGERREWTVPAQLDADNAQLSFDGISLHFQDLNGDIYVMDLETGEVEKRFDSDSTRCGCLGTYCLSRISANSVSQHRADLLYVHPNPANDMLIVEGSRMSEIQIYNLTGACLRTEKVNPDRADHQMDVSMLLPGIYFLHATSTGIDFQPSIFIKN